jgi:phosphomannomutase
LALQFGVYATDQLSIRVADLRDIAAMMNSLRSRPPGALLGRPLTELVDLPPPADVVILRTPQARAVVRPSGTEPKLKVYLEAITAAPPAKAGLVAARAGATVALRQLREEFATLLAPR